MKDFLSAKGVRFTELNISVDEEARKELVEKYGRLATPVLVVGEKMFLGFRQNRDEIEKLVSTLAGVSNG